MNIRTLINIGLLPVMMLVIFLDLYGQHHTIMCLYILGINLLAVYRARKNLYIFIVCAMITYCHYCIIFSYYIVEDYSRLKGLFYPYHEVSIAGIIILCLFSYGLLLAVPKIEDDAPPVRLITEDCRDNPYIVVAMALLILWCIFLSYDTSGHEGKRLLASGLNGWFRGVGYFLVFTLYYSGNRSITKKICIFLLLAYCIRSFLGGERLNALGAIISIYLALYAKKIKLRVIAIPAICLLILFEGIHAYRHRLFYMDNVIWAMLEATIEHKFIIDTPLGGWLAGKTFLYALNFDDWMTRLFQFGLWIKNVISIRQVGEETLTVYVQKYAINWGGGMFEYYFYYWLGFAGLLVAVLIVYFLFRILKRATSTDSGLIRCLAIYYTANTVSWYLYTPSGIFRAGGVLAIGYFLLDFGHNFMKGAAASLHSKTST